MDTQQFLVITAICMVILTGAVVYIAIYVVKVLKSVDETAKIAAQTARDIDAVRNGIKTGILSLVGGFIDQLQTKQLKDGEK